MKGSCGAPYFNNNNKVIGFQVESVDDVDVSISCGYVFCNLIGFKKVYKDIHGISTLL